MSKSNEKTSTESPGQKIKVALLFGLKVRWKCLYYS